MREGGGSLAFEIRVGGGVTVTQEIGVGGGEVKKPCHPSGVGGGGVWIFSGIPNVKYQDKQMLCKLCEIKSHGSWWNINRQYKTSSLMHALRAFYWD